MPLTRDVGKNYSHMKAKHPSWTRKHVLAASLSGAREAGNTSIKAPKKKRSKIAWGR